MTAHIYKIRVYHEDTDLGGIVYYANYFKFIERARSELLMGLGIDQVKLIKDGFFFVVRRVEANTDTLSDAFRYDLFVKKYDPQNLKFKKPENIAILNAPCGNVIIELYPSIAPNAVARFKMLIKSFAQILLFYCYSS